ncbi:hypothetical protein N7414_05065 [Pseudomonas sp. GD04087]|uniref:hypothetical protein n=1 Tax=Pseudomonas TaxID=286 RepID=UPI001F1CF6EA|nr:MULTISPECIES: hypothetical protein [Pseudomonas]MDH0288475.1 hypothetical protein [Pseudomonas sp. GD04087]MDH2000868.1 hypothetical protein [Pseudomonas sp. GD03691]
MRLFSKEKLAEILEEFNGVEGVVDDGLYISAYEEVARYISHQIAIDEMADLLKSNADELSSLPGEQYYFVEAAIDEYSAENLDVSGLINSSPERYRGYLRIRLDLSAP